MASDDYSEERLAEYDGAAIEQDDVLVMGFVSEVRRLRAVNADLEEQTASLRATVREYEGGVRVGMDEADRLVIERKIRRGAIAAYVNERRRADALVAALERDHLTRDPIVCPDEADPCGHEVCRAVRASRAARAEEVAGAPRAGASEEPQCTGRLVHDEFTVCPVHDERGRR
jgi:hypothetical protein